MVVVMAKPAIEGQVKTRLGAEIGESLATELYECFLADIARQVDAFTDRGRDRRRAVLAHANGPSRPGYTHFEERGFAMIRQGGGGLGERLTRVSQLLFDQGADQLIVIGADSPTLGVERLAAASDRLSHPDCDVVIGPAFDGGYYLIGLNEAFRAPFCDIDWSSRRVLHQTLNRCREAGLVCDLLEFWYDIDTKFDLRFLRDHLLDYLVERFDGFAPDSTEWLNERDSHLWTNDE